MTKTEYISEFGYIIGCNLEVLNLNEYGKIYDKGDGFIRIQMKLYRLN